LWPVYVIPLAAHSQVVVRHDSGEAIAGIATHLSGARNDKGGKVLGMAKGKVPAMTDKEGLAMTKGEVLVVTSGAS
jgi:hypothetical protein